MRKWLVGLLAAALCVSSALADTVKYTVTSKTAVEVSGTAPDGSSAEYTSDSTQVAQISSNKTATLTLKGFAGTTITGLTLSMKSNSKAGSGSLSVTCGDAIIASIEDSAFKDGWSDAYTTAYVDVTPEVTATAVADNEDVVITINGTVNSLYCQSYTIEYTAGDPVFSVKFDKENWFKVAQGQPSSVTAIPQYGIEPYTFLWDSDTPELKGGTTATLEIPDTLAEGDYTVACLVTEDNGEGDAINALIGFTVEAVPVITGDIYTLVENADDFEAGAEYLIVSYSKDKFTSALKNEANGSRIGVEEVEIAEDKTVTTGSDAIVWTIKAGEAEGQYVLFNEAKNVYAAGPSSEGNNAQLLSDGSDALAQWTLDFSGLPAVAIGSVAYPERQLTRNSTATYEYFATYKGSGTKPYLFKKSGATGLSVTFDKANGFTVDFGTADSITATAKNGAEPYTYAWTSDTPDLNGTGETLAIPATLAEGDYTVQVEVTDAEANKANKQIYFSVVAPLEPHAINIDVGIQNGTVTSDPEGEAVKGTQVKLTATATTEGYALKEMTVTYGETVLTFTASPATFEMPDEAVSVGATFEEVKDYAELPFVAEDTPYSGPWKGATVDGLTSKGLGTDYGDGSAKLDSTGDWLQVKFAGTPGTLSYGIKGNSVSADNPSTFLVQESADGETWSPLATYVSGDNLGDKTEASHELSASSQFVRFFYETKGAGNVGIYDVYITSGGPAVFSITLDPAKDFEVEQNAEAFVTAIPKHAAEGVVGYAWWIDGTPVDTAGEVLALATAELGPHKVICEATDAAGAKADAHVIYTVVAPAVKYAVNVALDIQNGTVTTDVPEAAEGDLVTVTATPEAGYRLVEIIVNNGEVAVTGNTFVMPGQDVLVTATFEEKPPVTGDVLTNDDVGSQTSSYKDWTATKESGAVYAGQTAGGSATNPCIQLRSSGNSGIVMTKDSGQNVASVTIEWNAQSAAERVVQVYGSTTPYSSPADLYGDAKGTLLGELTNGSGEVTVDVAAVGEFPYIGIRSKSGALFLTSVAIDFGGAAAFSIALDPAEDFEVQQGKDAAITATVRGAQGDVTYSWSVNGTPIDLAGNVYAIDSAEVGGPFTVVCEASDGVSEPVSASVSYTVVEVPPVTGDEFALISSLDSLQDGTRVVLTDPDGTLALSATVASSVFTTTAVEPVGDVITTDNANIIWKLVDDGEGNFSLYNEEAGKYAGHAGGGTSNSGRLQDDPFPNAISLGEDGLFVIAATTADSAENYRDLQYNYNSGNARFAYYKGTQKNLRIYAAESGPASPKIVYSGETTIALGGTFEIIFGLLNYDGDFTWEMGSREGGTIVPEGRDGLYTWTPTEATGDEGVTIKVVARSGELDIATKEVVLTVTEPGPQPGQPALVFGGDTEGTVGTPVNFTVTSVNVVTDPTVYPDGFTAPEGSTLTDDNIDYGEEAESRNVSFTPDVPGDYVFTFVAGAEGASDEVRDSVTITVTGEAEGPTIDSTTVENISFKGGLSGTVSDELAAQYQNVKAQVLVFNAAEHRFDVANELDNEAAWPEMKFTPASKDAIIRLIFVK